MKKLFVFLFAIALTATFSSAKAQVSINVNIGSQPLWGPTGYDHVDYYYLPDIDSYYYVPTRQFVYLSNGNWIFAAGLPSRYRDYDLYHGYKVVVNSPRPYLHHHDYQVRYSRYRNVYTQPVIVRSHDSRYHGIPGHPDYGHPDYGHHEPSRNVRPSRPSTSYQHTSYPSSHGKSNSSHGKTENHGNSHGKGKH